MCTSLPTLQLDTRLALIMHHRELSKTTATGPLALACLPNSELHIHGRQDAPLKLDHLLDESRRSLVLFPAEDARPLDQAMLDEDPRPITLVVPDGNWRQARRMPHRIPELANLPRVTLPQGLPSQWGVRWEPKAEGLATFEAIARALGALESKPIQEQLERVFQHMVQTTLAARGSDKAGVLQTSTRQNPPLPILFQDGHLVAINKPSGMPAHRGWAQDGEPALQCLRDQLGRFVYPVHRLDRATSGVLIFALSSEVARDMQQALSEQQVDKRYLALCRGHDSQLTHVNHALAKTADSEPLPASTDFRLLGKFERYGLYEARPHGGRTHQIRRHLKHASHPIVGDVRYGKGEHNRLFRDRFNFHRLALHCASMTFKHPRTGEPLALQAPLPEDFRHLLEQLQLAHAIHGR